jgi:hypothetical protein
MIAALAIGVLSPALGVLWVLIHAPADLLATAVMHAPGAQLEPAATAIPARLISDAVLWIGAVELPLLARRWAATWPAALADRPSTVRSASVMALAMAVLAYLWINTAFWLVMPVFNWTSQGGPGAVMPLGMVVATLWYGWIAVVAVTAIAFIAGLATPVEAVTASAYERTPAQPGLGRELVGFIVVGVLLSGLMLRPSEAVMPSDEIFLIALIVGGLVIAGPVLSRVLPRVPVPAWLAGAPPVVRWGLAIIVAFAGTWLVVSLVPVGALPDYLLLAILFAIFAPVVRIVVDAGTPAGRAADATVSATLGTILRLVLILGVWLAVPAIALGHDESPGMPQGNPAGAGGLIGAAAAAAAAASRRTGDKGGSNSPWGKPPGGKMPKETPSTPPPSKKPPEKDAPKQDDGFKWWNPATWF